MVDWMPDNVGLGTFVDEDKDDHEILDFALIYVCQSSVEMSNQWLVRNVHMLKRPLRKSLPQRPL